MSLALRLLLVAVSLCTFVFVIRKIRKSQIRLEDSLFWIVVAFLVLLASLFPQILIYAAAWLGVESAANFVFLLFIFILLVKTFSLSIRLSQADAKISELVQQLGVERLDRHRSQEDRRRQSAK